MMEGGVLQYFKWFHFFWALTFEDDLINEDNLKNEDELKNDDDLKMKMTSKMKTTWKMKTKLKIKTTSKRKMPLFHLPPPRPGNFFSPTCILAIPLKTYCGNISIKKVLHIKKAGSKSSLSALKSS